MRRQIGERVRLRLTPEIRFVHDEAVERGERVLSLLKKIESTDDQVSHAKREAAHQGAGFWDGDEHIDQVATPTDNPFLEGVGDSDYDDSDDDLGSETFFSADMFPDANPVLDDIAAQKRQMEWKGQSKKAKYKVKGGKAVRK